MTVAIVLPTLIILAVFAVDIANWYYHKRHLQTQADAGALAAAHEIKFSGTGACSSTGYDTTARNYGQQQYNAQIGGTPSANIHIGLGQATWFGHTDATVVPGDPCVSSMIDVKTAETDLPFLFGVDLVPHIRAHARVEFKKETTASKKSPIAVKTDQMQPGVLVNLKLSSNSSETQAVDCDPGKTGTSKLEEELASPNGCPATFTVDPNNPATLSDCATFDASTTAKPWFCIPLNPGNKPGQVGHGLNLRVYGDKNQHTCPATNRNEYPTLNPGDPRLVDVFITSYQFDNSAPNSNSAIPITGFATFYLTGWENDPCIGVSPKPDTAAENGGISGYFVRKVDFEGTGGNASCVLSNPADLNTCVAVLTQ